MLPRHIDTSPARSALLHSTFIGLFTSWTRHVCALPNGARGSEEWRIGQSCWAAPNAVFRSLHKFAMRPSLTQARQPMPVERRRSARHGCAFR